MKIQKNMMWGLSIAVAMPMTLLQSADAALVSGYDQRFQADDYGATTAGVWDEEVSGQDATAVGTFATTTTANGSTAIVNEGSGQEMLFTRGAALTGSFTIQMVIRLDTANTDDRQGPFALDEAAGWSGLYMGANLGGTSNLRAGNMGNTGGSGTVLSGSTSNSLTAGTWGIYTLIGDQNATNQLTATFDLLVDGSTAFSVTDSIASNTDPIGGLSSSGRLFGGDMGGGANGSTDEWLGAIADVVVYNSVLDSSQLAANEAEFQALYQVPEPSSALLLSLGGLGLLARRRRA